MYLALVVCLISRGALLLWLNVKRKGQKKYRQFGFSKSLGFQRNIKLLKEFSRALIYCSGNKEVTEKQAEPKLKLIAYFNNMHTYTFLIVIPLYSVCRLLFTLFFSPLFLLLLFVKNVPQNRWCVRYGKL